MKVLRAIQIKTDSNLNIRFLNSRLECLLSKKKAHIEMWAMKY